MNGLQIVTMQQKINIRGFQLRFISTISQLTFYSTLFMDVHP